MGNTSRSVGTQQESRLNEFCFELLIRLRYYIFTLILLHTLEVLDIMQLMKSFPDSFIQCS